MSVYDRSRSGWGGGDLGARWDMRIWRCGAPREASGSARASGNGQGRGCGRRDYLLYRSNLFPGRPRRAPRRDNRAGVGPFRCFGGVWHRMPVPVRCCIACRAECRTVSTVVQHPSPDSHDPCPTERGPPAEFAEVPPRGLPLPDRPEVASLDSWCCWSVTVLPRSVAARTAVCQLCGLQ